jgi:hypothetical protein
VLRSHIRGKPPAFIVFIHVSLLLGQVRQRTLWSSKMSERADLQAIGRRKGQPKKYIPCRKTRQRRDISWYCKGRTKAGELQLLWASAYFERVIEARAWKGRVYGHVMDKLVLVFRLIYHLALSMPQHDTGQHPVCPLSLSGSQLSSVHVY